VADPVRFEISLADGLWRVSREGDAPASFSHAEEAVHEAVGRAHAIIHTGEPAEVWLYPQDGQAIEVDLSEPMRVAHAEEERSAVVPDRGPSA
jgi:hypothetical protein